MRPASAPRARLRTHPVFVRAGKVTPISIEACIILDINLNDGSGIELRHRLKADGISVPVIFITGNEDPAVRQAALNSGCMAFLTKPLSAQALIDPLKKASAGLS